MQISLTVVTVSTQALAAVLLTFMCTINTNYDSSLSMKHSDIQQHTDEL